ncbi:MAG: type IV secretory system conjugative DNA transfer family protein [Syntrophotalea acetylenica]|nr:type IV secretory system conjugative DNA transfer family protein [Syntrophotalea acetylenica]
MAATAIGLVLTLYTLPVGAEETPSVLTEIQEKTAPATYSNETFSNLRPEAIREAAHTLGLQAGVKYRYDQILTRISERESAVDSTFDFRTLLLHNGSVLPPVIIEGRDGFALKSDREFSTVDVTYRILQPARFVSAPPHWRDYLWHKFSVVDNVSPAVLPKASDEREIWRAAAKKGWDAGIEQADRVFQANLNRLVRDFQGMLRFNALVAQGVIGMPMVAKGELGVRIGDQVLDVNQRVFRITVPAKFRGVEEWKPIISQTNH